MANPQEQSIRRGGYLVVPAAQRNLLDWSSEDEANTRDGIVNEIVRENPGGLTIAADYQAIAAAGIGIGALPQGPPYALPLVISPIIREPNGTIRDIKMNHLYVNVFIADFGPGTRVVVKGLPATPRGVSAIAHEVAMTQRFSGIAARYVVQQTLFNGGFRRILLEFKEKSLFNIIGHRDNEANYDVVLELFKCMKTFESQGYLMRDTRLKNFRVEIGK